MAQTVKLGMVGGRRAIGTNDLVYCNTKYHAPYLARIDESGKLEWQDKEYTGYGKHRETYYVVEALRAGDLIQAAGGSGGNKYPFRGRVISISEDTLEVESVDDRDWSNLLAGRKRAPAPSEASIPSAIDQIVELARRLTPEQRAEAIRGIEAL